MKRTPLRGTPTSLSIRGGADIELVAGASETIWRYRSGHHSVIFEPKACLDFETDDPAGTIWLEVWKNQACLATRALSRGLNHFGPQESEKKGIFGIELHENDLCEVKLFAKVGSAKIHDVWLMYRIV